MKNSRYPDAPTAAVSCLRSLVTEGHKDLVSWVLSSSWRIFVRNFGGSERSRGQGTRSTPRDPLGATIVKLDRSVIGQSPLPQLARTRRNKSLSNATSALRTCDFTRILCQPSDLFSTPHFKPLLNNVFLILLVWCQTRRSTLCSDFSTLY